MSSKQISTGYTVALNNASDPGPSINNSKQVLPELVDTDELDEKQNIDDRHRDEDVMIATHKATLRNPNIGEDTKAHIRQVLSEHGVNIDS
ncbi:uncharacterized protein IL334_004654 [Kwoniella shivajii]|uniref:Uncharacterized protein n=1 Tax=Kwoniella shivajii TaxID=564305 RepID=A0ABZ1D263_9TREE|nr:hypothetical protein IL334_004654 [Kwoniella shivajii]